MWQIAVDCRQIAVRLPSRGRSLIAKSVETGRRMQGVTGVSRDNGGFTVNNLWVSRDDADRVTEGVIIIRC
jgi:hypothetical protein